MNWEEEWKDFGQAPFHYSQDECECVGAYGTMHVWVHTHARVCYNQEFCVPLGMYVQCRHYRMCLCPCALCLGG